jgi:hypothetical protein
MGACDLLEVLLHGKDPNPRRRVVANRTMGSRPTGLLYHRGFARPFPDVFRGVPKVFNDRWEQLKGLSDLFREGFSIRRLFSRSPIPDRVGVSDQLINIIISTRVVLVLIASGLALVILALALPEFHTQLNYVATLPFVTGWAVIKYGILDRDPNWVREACILTLKWYGMFLGVALVGGYLEFLIDPRLGA